MRSVVMVQGLQFGSEAKGAISAGVAKHWRPDTVATAWGPNAGHTVRDGDLKFVSCMLASGALFPSVERILIGPGSVVDFNRLAAEVEMAGDRLRGKELIIHPNAAVLKPEHAVAEAALLRIGSTMKGTMEAAVDKMRRKPDAIARGVPPFMLNSLFVLAEKFGLMVYCSARRYAEAIDESYKLVMEGAQGFGLSLHGKFYPYCTSRDVSPAQTLADCRVPIPAFGQKFAVIGVIRTYPIRVANRVSDDGQQFTSGGFYDDQHELDWKRDLMREPELTTVTKLPRRIFNFSHEQLEEAIVQVQPSSLSLTFCDYIDAQPSNGRIGNNTVQFLNAIHATALKANRSDLHVDTVSYGPDLADIYNVDNAAGDVDDRIFQMETKNHARYFG